MLRPPKFMFMGLQSPAIYLGATDWEMNKHVFINGEKVEGNDTPWNAVVADLLIDQNERKLVGVTFAIRKPDFCEPMRRIANRLDRRVVRYNDLQQDSEKRLYQAAGDAPHIEIYWSTARQPGFELAQILCGQWFWWYAATRTENSESSVIAFGVADLDELLSDHRLILPDLHLPKLDVRFA